MSQIAQEQVQGMPKANRSRIVRPNDVLAPLAIEVKEEKKVKAVPVGRKIVLED